MPFPAVARRRFDDTEPKPRGHGERTRERKPTSRALPAGRDEASERASELASESEADTLVREPEPEAFVLRLLVAVPRRRGHDPFVKTVEVHCLQLHAERPDPLSSNNVHRR